MKTFHLRLIYWTPRLLGLLFAGFISLFALDVFDHQHSFWSTLLALAQHLIPTAICLLLLVLAWRWEWTGVLSFAALALFYLVAFRGRFHWSAYACIAGPLLLLSVLFFISWQFRAKARLATPANSSS